MPDTDRVTTATASGYHFLNTYQSCRWRWHLHYNRKLIPLKTSRYLLFGQAFHSAKEAFYTSEAVDRSQFAMVGEVHLRMLIDQYEKADHYREDLDKMKVMCNEWWDTFAEAEFETYEILAVEEEMFIPLPGRFIMTVRPDVVVRNKGTKLVYAFETKTTSKSIYEMARSVACEKQVDTQIMGIQAKMHALGIPQSYMGGVIPDITYSRQSVKSSARTDPVKRSPKELADTKLSFSGLFAEIGQKVQAISDPATPPELLFDRNGAWCARFGCEYEPICTSRFTACPVGYRFEQ